MRRLACTTVTASAHDLARWSETLAAIARTGLGFTQSLYERERFEEVLHVAADIKAAAREMAEALEVQRETDHFVQEWMESIGEGVPGYVTPKVAIGAIVGNDRGELLLVQRTDSGIWLYPTGWADVGYSPAEVAVKEVEEETGIECEPLRLLGVIDGQRMGFTRFGMYMLLFHCVAIGGELRPHPLETADVGWFADDALPEPDGRGAVVGTDGVRRDPRRGRRRPRSTRSAHRCGAWSDAATPDRGRCGSVVGAVAQEPFDLVDQLVGVDRFGEVVVAVLVVVGSSRHRRRRRRPSARDGARIRPGRRRRRSATTRGVVLGGCGGEPVERRGRADHRAGPLDERHRRLRRRDLRGVAGNRRPERRGGQAMALQGVLQHADDAGRALVLRPLEFEALHHRVVGGRADQLHGPRVRDVGEQRAERERHR